MLYRIITENKNLDKIQKIIGADFGSYTYYPAYGVWKGEEECAAVFEIGDTNMALPSIIACAAKIKIINEQENILIQKIPCENILI